MELSAWCGDCEAPAGPFLTRSQAIEELADAARKDEAPTGTTRAEILSLEEHRFTEISFVWCKWVCPDCLNGREVESLGQVGQLDNSCCCRCGRKDPRLVAVKDVCHECKLPPSSRPDPSCGRCITESVMES